LKDSLEREKEWKKKVVDAHKGLGASQAFHLGEVSNYE
jgi:hypothetical protein